MTDVKKVCDDVSNAGRELHEVIEYMNERQVKFMLRMERKLKVRECYNEVEEEDDGRQSIALQILQKSADFLRRIIVPVEGQGGVTQSYV